MPRRRTYSGGARDCKEWEVEEAIDNHDYDKVLSCPNLDGYFRINGDHYSVYVVKDGHYPLYVALLSADRYKRYNDHFHLQSIEGGDYQEYYNRESIPLRILCR